MNLVFWQNILSPHQAAFLRSLAKTDHEVTVVCAEPMTEDRIALGWTVPNLGCARVITSPSPTQISKLVQDSPKTSVHVMAGARWTSLGTQALDDCLAAKRRIGIMSESPDPRGAGGYARWAKYTFERITKGRHYDFVLAMGQMGIRWFRRCGYTSRKVFPFAYATEPPQLPATNTDREKTILLFAGRFVPLKGLDLLLRAFAAFGSKRVELRLLGDGPERPRLEALAVELGISGQIVWLPRRDPEGVQVEMGKADLTLLPSYKDGWGAVINESLMIGTPVLCSSACGASELIRQPCLGSVFRSGSTEGLAHALQHWLQRGPRTETERECVRNWAECISGEAIAKYLTAILNYIYGNSESPQAPWRRMDDLNSGRPSLLQLSTPKHFIL